MPARFGYLWRNAIDDFLNSRVEGFHGNQQKKEYCGCNSSREIDTQPSVNCC